MKKHVLSSEQAYLAMYAYLDAYYERGKSSEIGGMLGDMSFLEDGGTADPACMRDWNEAVEKVMNGSVSAKLTFPE